MHEREACCAAYLPGVGTACSRCGWSAATHTAAVVFDWQAGSFAIFGESVVQMTQQELLELSRRAGQMGGALPYDFSIRPDPDERGFEPTWWQEGARRDPH